MTKKNFHENFAEYDSIKGPSNKNFGFTVGGIFIAIASVKTVFFSFSLLAAIFFVIGGILVGGAFIKPDLLTPLNKAWMKLAEILALIVTPVVMFLIYLICFIPIGMIMKLVGYDPLNRKFEKNSKTYWIVKKQHDLEQPMKYQF